MKRGPKASAESRDMIANKAPNDDLATANIWSNKVR